MTPSHRPLPDTSRQSKQTSLFPVRFEPAIPASHWPQTHALDRQMCQAAFGIVYRPLTDNQAFFWQHLTALFFLLTQLLEQFEFQDT